MIRATSMVVLPVPAAASTISVAPRSSRIARRASASGSARSEVGGTEDESTARHGKRRAARAPRGSLSAERGAPFNAPHRLLFSRTGRLSLFFQNELEHAVTALKEPRAGKVTPQIGAGETTCGTASCDGTERCGT